MKKILFLLLSTIAMYGQVPADATPLENIQITNNTTDNSATKVNVQSTDGTINTISKSDLVNVVEVNDVPSLPLVGEVGKIYVVKNVNKIYRWNGTFYQELAGSDISGKEDIANKQNSLSVDGSNTKYPTVTAVNTGLGLKENILNNPITGVGSQNNANTYALQDGTVLYHSTKWFVPSGAVSTIGATVTSVDTQFTSAMVGAKLTINGEWRIITAYTNATNVTVASAYSQNYSNVVAGNWGVYSKAIILQLGVVMYYTVVGELYMESSGTMVNVTSLATRSGKAFFGDGYLSGYSGQVIQWTPTGMGNGAKDLGLRRNSAGVLEIYDGITPTGLEANRRDLLARKLFGSKVLIGSIVDDNVNQGQYTGTVSSGTTALNNTPPIANNQLTRKDYVDTGLALKAPLASPSLTGTPTAPTATAGANTTQVATTAFVTNGIATADSQNVKLTGDQTISGQKSFSLTGKIDMQTNNAFPAISATAIGSNGRTAAEFINSSSSPYSTALNLQTDLSGGVGNATLSVLNSSSIGTGIVSNASNGGVSISSQSGDGDSYISNITFGGTGRNYVGRNNGTETYSVDKIGNVLGNSYIKRSTPANNILLAGGGDLAQGTAFNKNFGTTVGTIVEGGTLGSNAYNSTAYQPLLTNPVTGTGTTNYIPKFTASGTVGNSSIFDNGTNVGIGTNSPTTKLIIEQSNNNSSVVIRNGVTASHNAIYIGNDSVNNSSFLGSYKGDDSNFSTLILQKFGGKVLIPDLSGTGTRQVVADASGNLSATSSPLDSRPYKVYTALLSQSGTNAPTAVVLENTLGGTVVWSRSSTGIYIGTLSGAFTVNKTLTLMNTGYNVNGFEGINRVDVNSVQIQTYTNIPTYAYADGRLANGGASIEIRVYN